MPKKVSYKESGGDSYFNAPAGGHPAIIVGVMELGTESRDFQNDGKFREFSEIRILYEIEAEQEIYDKEKEELTGEFEDKIGIIGANYNDVISDKSNLGKVINAVCDVKSVKEIKNFSLDQLLGQKCFIDVELKGKDKKYGFVKSVSGASKKIKYHEQETEGFYFGMEDPDDFLDILNDDIIKKYLKPWDLTRLKASSEYRELCRSQGWEIEETLDEQEENLKKEQEEAMNEPTVSEDEAKKIFDEEDDEEEVKIEKKSEVEIEEKDIIKEEPKTTSKAREESANSVKDTAFE